MTARTGRRGFTLVELLVVIAILAVLASLILAAVMRTRSAQQVKTTEETLKKMESVFARQRSAVLDTARMDTIPPVVLALAANDTDRAKVLWAYIKYRRAFPKDFAEATNPITITVPGVGTTALAAPQIFRNLPAGGGSPQLQAAACAYLFLTARAERGEEMSMVEGAGAMVMDVDVGAYKVKVFKDSFGNPITFVRDGRAPELNLAPYVKQGATFLDPFDPLGKLTKTTAWNPGANAQQNAQLIGLAHTAAFGVTGAFVNENWTATFVSAGVDRAFGNADDIVGYRVRQGN